MTMAETHFAIAYDGPALETGRMPVRELAPALLALGELFAEASGIVYPEAEPVGLSVKATEHASFDVHLILEAKDIWDQMIHGLDSDTVSALTNLEALILSGTGLFAVLRRIGRKKVSKEEPAAAPGQVKVTFEDGMTIEMPADVSRMVKRMSIRRKARDVVAPLSRDGVEVVEFSRDPEQLQPDLVITKDDLDAYEAAALEEGDILLDEEREMIVQIAAVSFEGRKWRLSDGNLTFWASIEDHEFLSEVERRAELFAKGDMLRCRIRVVQYRRSTGGLKTDYHVVRVIQHISGPTQLTFEDDAEDT